MQTENMEINNGAKGVLRILDGLAELLQGYDHAAAILALVKMTAYLIHDSKLDPETEKALLDFVIKDLAKCLEEAKECSKK
jgi:hypothetical protein